MGVIGIRQDAFGRTVGLVTSSAKRPLEARRRCSFQQKKTFTLSKHPLASSLASWLASLAC